MQEHATNRIQERTNNKRENITTFSNQKYHFSFVLYKLSLTKMAGKSILFGEWDRNVVSSKYVHSQRCPNLVDEQANPTKIYRTDKITNNCHDLSLAVYILSSFKFKLCSCGRYAGPFLSFLRIFIGYMVLTPALREAFCHAMSIFWAQIIWIRYFLIGWKEWFRYVPFLVCGVTLNIWAKLTWNH